MKLLFFVFGFFLLLDLLDSRIVAICEVGDYHIFAQYGKTKTFVPAIATRLSLQPQQNFFLTFDLEKILNFPHKHKKNHL